MTCRLREGRCRRKVIRTLLFTLALTVAVASAAAGYEGFGAATPGGANGAVVHVTNLNDAGPGSLRDALSAGNRTIVFDVGGDIVLKDYLYVRGAFITIDGFSAPAPGITLRGRGLVIRGTQGAHDVIVTGLRVRSSPIDSLQVAYGAYNIVISHVSLHGAGDGNLDITADSHDVTVAWSIIAEPASGKSMLIKYNAQRLTLHHNLFVRGNSRNPAAAVDDAGTPATDTTVDLRNNLFWDWRNGFGTLIHHGAAANVVDNFYSSPGSTLGNQKDALIVCKGPDCFGGDLNSRARAYTEGNVSGDPIPIDINTEGTETEPFAAPPVTTTGACTAAPEVLAAAGVRPLDAVDTAQLAAISLPPCAP
jgi:pectate lyase